MQHCIHCQVEIIKNAKFCSSCGKSQEAIDSIDNLDFIQPIKKGNSSFLTTLCILTLVGSALGILRGLLYQAIASDTHFGNSEFIRGWLYVLVNIGTIAGAVVLLKKKNIGLYIYTVFQVLYLILIIWALSIYGTDEMSITIAAFFFLPSLAFLIMYWTKPIRNNLH